MGGPGATPPPRPLVAGVHPLVERRAEYWLPPGSMDATTNRRNWHSGGGTRPLAIATVAWRIGCRVLAREIYGSSIDWKEGFVVGGLPTCSARRHRGFAEVRPPFGKFNFRARAAGAVSCQKCSCPCNDRSESPTHEHRHFEILCSMFPGGSDRTLQIPRQSWLRRLGRPGLADPICMGARLAWHTSLVSVRWRFSIVSLCALLPARPVEFV